jgi:pimeloyl-ACP methyl ester carboxylesterase
LVIGCSGLRSAVDGARLVVVLLRWGGLETLSAAADPGDLVLGRVLVGGGDVRLEVVAVP